MFRVRKAVIRGGLTVAHNVGLWAVATFENAIRGLLPINLC